jgi:hypothetical protein
MVHITAMIIQYGVIENETVGNLLSVSITPWEGQELKEWFTVAVESIVREIVFDVQVTLHRDKFL